MTQTTPTCLWNDSAALDELAYSIEHGAVGATCNPVIALSILKRQMLLWRDRIETLVQEMSTATEDQIGWKIVEEMSVKGAALLKPIFDAQGGRNGRLSIQTDPRFYRSTREIVDQAVHFSQLAPNMIVKIPATRAGIAAMEEATYRGISINATVSFTLPQAIAVAEAVERGLARRSRLSGVGRCGCLQEDLRHLPRARLPPAAALRCVPQPHALERVHWRGRGDFPTLLLAGPLQRQRYRSDSAHG
jgi:transaldolase